MKGSTRFWLFLFVVSGLFLSYRAATTEMGRVYVETEVVKPEGSSHTWNKHTVTEPKNRNDANVHFSLARTLGVWIAAFLTLMIFSFLYGDSVCYRLAEAIFVGVSAGYAMVVGFWNEIMGKLIKNLAPDFASKTYLPSMQKWEVIDGESVRVVLASEWLYLVPLVLGIMMLMRLSPVGGWISRWPLAFFIGATAGIRLIGFLEADFVRQVQSTLIPLVVLTSEGTLDFWNSIKNCTIVFGVLTSLVYFFFSVEHTGAVGQTARIGIWVLMITFGAGFAFTVMSRIALLIQRLEFLFDDWLWLIDPAGKRMGL